MPMLCRFYCECCGKEFDTYEKAMTHMKEHLKVTIHLDSDEINQNQTEFSEDAKSTIMKVVDVMVKVINNDKTQR